MRIFVKSLAFPGYKKIELDISNLRRIKEIKEWIATERKIPIELQRLTFKGEILHDETLISKYNIEKSSTLNMFLRFKEEIQLNIRCSNGNTITIETRETATIRSLISSIFMHDNNHRSLGPTGVSLYMGETRLSDGIAVSKYKMKDGSTLFLDYPCDFSYILPYDLADSREQKMKERAQLLFGPSADKNPEEKVVEDSTKIYIKLMKSKIITIDYTLQLTVLDVKSKIMEMEKIPLFLQSLSFKGIRLDSDTSPLITYAIKAESILLLELEATTISIQCEVWMREKKTEEILWMQVGLNDKIKDMKARIRELKGFAPEKQRVLYKKTPLEPEGTFFDYHIENRASLRLYLDRDSEIPVFIKTLDGVIYPFQLDVSDTVEALKEKLFYIEEIPINRQCLFVDNKLIVNSDLLSESEIKEGSTLLIFDELK